MGGDPESNPAETEAIKGEEAPEAKEKPAAEEHNYIVRGNLKLRAGESLTSEAVGNIEAGTTVYVVDRKNLADGHDRALIAVNKDTPLGWVSVHAKDGFEQLREIAPGEHHHDEIAKLGNIRNKHHRASIIEEMYSMKPVHHNDHHVHAQAPGTQVKGAPPGTITKPITHGEHGEHDEHEEGMGIDHSDQWVCAVRRCVLLQHQPQSVLKFVMQATRPIGSSEGQVGPCRLPLPAHPDFTLLCPPPSLPGPFSSQPLLCKPLASSSLDHHASRASLSPQSAAIGPSMDVVRFDWNQPTGPDSARLHSTRLHSHTGATHLTRLDWA